MATETKHAELRVLRGYIAIGVPETHHDEVLASQGDTLKVNPSFRFNGALHPHVSVHYLNTLRNGNTEKVADVLANIASDYGQFPIEVDGLSLMPGKQGGGGGIVCLRVVKSEQLADLNRRLGLELGELAKPINSGDSYVPHITLGWYPSMRRRDLRRSEQRLRKLGLGGWSFEATELALHGNKIDCENKTRGQLAVFPLGETSDPLDG